ncbi:MAG: hemerythrin domain-containing protein [Gammaproteobacteria bacterium]|nr:hemerythrin domain-containing protein [Gammaproteobacteria bacterium]
MKIKEFMARDHKDCDLLFAKAENATAKDDWDTARQTFNEFVQAMERHLGIEEQVLFPAFEEETGMATGPTEMMRMEHEQMRTLFAEMKEAMEQQDSDDYLGAGETLLIMMQQHNIKEEQILYNIMDQHLPDDIGHWQEKFENWNNA